MRWAVAINAFFAGANTITALDAIKADNAILAAVAAAAACFSLSIAVWTCTAEQ